ncbi:hypothetical protein GCM10023205_68140 [Yinghuangia aomiensis]|uniref:Purine-cytosine permease n=1 Tax=Yinghuangia aomiensis TaxID=676205 RepID=A0ABP9I510_9ACTN
MSGPGRTPQRPAGTDGQGAGDDAGRAADVADDFAHTTVPDDARIGRTRLTMASWSLATGMAWLFYGALASTLAGTRDALLGLGLSVVVFALANMPMVRIATTTGMSSALASQRVFGRAGAALIALLLAATTVYFAVFEGSVMAEAFHQQWGHDIRWWYLAVVVGLLPLMMGGVLTWLDKLNAALLPLYVVGITAALAAAGRRGDPGAFWDFPGVVPEAARVLPGWLTVFVLYLGIWLVMPTTVDFARFGRARDTRFLQTVTFGWVFGAVVFAVNGAIGMFLVQMVLPGSAVAAENGVVSAIVGPLGVWGVLLIVVTQVRINTLNFYQSSTNIQRLVKQFVGVRIPRPAAVVAVGVLTFVLMLTDVFSYLQKALSWQGTFFVGWVGIVLADLALRTRKGAPGVRVGAACTVWVLSAAAGIVLIQSPERWPEASALAPVVSLGLAMAGYLALALWPHHGAAGRRGAPDRAEAVTRNG